MLRLQMERTFGNPLPDRPTRKCAVRLMCDATLELIMPSCTPSRSKT